MTQLPALNTLPIGTLALALVGFFFLYIAYRILYVLVRVIYVVIRLLYARHQGHLAARRAKSFSAPGGLGKRILIIGDSTAFGTGAEKPEDSIAGQLAHDFPGTQIINYAVNGALTEDTVEQVSRAKGEKYDMVIISTGGNDIWHFTSYEKIAAALKAVLEQAIMLSNHRVVVLLYADFGHSPVLPDFLRRRLQRRTETVQRLFAAISASAHVLCIDIYTAQGTAPGDSNPFAQNPAEYYAPDYMHPNSKGYALWYRRMWREMVENHFFFDERK
jgi:lysophospholipase L1-like esterase